MPPQAGAQGVLRQSFTSHAPIVALGQCPEIINVDQKSLIVTVMIKATKYSEFHENVNVEHQNDDDKINTIRAIEYIRRIVEDEHRIDSDIRTRSNTTYTIGNIFIDDLYMEPSDADEELNKDFEVFRNLMSRANKIEKRNVIRTIEKTARVVPPTGNMTEEDVEAFDEDKTFLTNNGWTKREAKTFRRNSVISRILHWLDQNRNIGQETSKIYPVFLWPDEELQPE